MCTRRAAGIPARASHPGDRADVLTGEIGMVQRDWPIDQANDDIRPADGQRHELPQPDQVDRIEGVAADPHGVVPRSGDHPSPAQRRRAGPEPTGAVVHGR
jgi:hypothetical protein